MTGLGDIADGVLRSIGQVQDGVEEYLFEPVIRLGVTGLARAGKTVFITSLIANLLDRGRMPQLRAAAEARVIAAYLQPQPDDAVPRFEFEDHLTALMGDTPRWPDSTRSISQLRLSLKVKTGGLLGMVSGPRTVHLDIVDYPGEWLLDLPLLGMGFDAWSAATLRAARAPARASAAEAWLAQSEKADPAARLNEGDARALAASFTGFLAAGRAAGLSALAPGRFLMPGDLDGSPALAFAPLEKPARAGSDSLYAAFERRFEAYKRIVVKPFFRDHFSRIDRQVVLVDALGAINAGPQAVEDLRVALKDILETFRPGPNSWLAPILGKRVERILFAATKADHLHHTQHGRLAAIMEALVDEARRTANFKGATTQSLALASLRATVEESREHNGETLDLVRGTLLDTGREAAMFPGDLPEDPARLLAPAREGSADWLNGDYQVMRFAPPRMVLRPGEGPPHIRLDRAAEFLIGDRLS